MVAQWLRKQTCIWKVSGLNPNNAKVLSVLLHLSSHSGVIYLNTTQVSVKKNGVRLQPILTTSIGSVHDFSQKTETL